MTKIVNKIVNTHLVGTDRNAFALMGTFRKQARRDGWSKEEIDLVINEAMAGDYDHLLQVLCSHTLDFNEPENEGFVEEAEEKSNLKMKAILNEEFPTQESVEAWEKKRREGSEVVEIIDNNTIEDLPYLIQKSLTNLITVSGANISHMESLLTGKNVSRPQMREALQTQREYLSDIEVLKDQFLSILEKAKTQRVLEILDTVDPVEDDEPKVFDKPWYERDLTGVPIICKAQSCRIIVDEGKTVLIESPTGRVRAGKFYPYQYRVLRNKIKEEFINEDKFETVLLVKTNPDPLSYELQSK